MWLWGFWRLGENKCSHGACFMLLELPVVYILEIPKDIIWVIGSFDVYR